MEKLIKIIFLTLTLCSNIQNIFSKDLIGDVCVADEFNVTAVSGRVVLSNQTIIDNLSVKLSKDILGEKIIQEIKTDSSGKFIFQNIKPDRYFLILRSENLESLTFFVKYKKSDSRHPLVGIKVTMSFIAPGECSKAEAEIVHR